ncbi:MAG: helix-turn-helix transcriptional regulator [Lentisphaerae bacterium]|nr:helix-turn-helix transcriptional regulator [Lentisphaerota bacterium]
MFFDGIEFVCLGSFQNFDHINTRKFNDYYGVQFNYRGLFIVNSDDRRYELEGPHVLITRPGPEFVYGAGEGKSRSHHFVCFKGPRADSYINSGLLDIRPEKEIIRITSPDKLLASVNRLCHMMPFNTQLKYSRAVNILEDILLQLKEQPDFDHSIPDYLRPILEKFHSEVTARPELYWNLQGEAETNGMSYSHFRRTFKQLYGISPKTHILTQRLQKATQMLLETNLQVAEIAELCGFENQYYFSRIFKKHFFFSPVRYRKELR